jgi:hypothetical protein
MNDNMARQIAKINTNQSVEEVHSILQKHFEEKGYELRKYQGVPTLCRESHYGRSFFAVYYKTGILKIEGWIPSGKKELALDENIYGALPKKGLKNNLDEIIKLFDGCPYENYNSDTVSDSLNNNDYILQNFNGLKSDFKQFAFLSLGLGILCFVIPLPIIIIIIGAIGGIYYGLKGLNSTVKWAAIIGLILSAVDIIALLMSLFGEA